MHKIKGLFSRQKNANNKFTKTYYSIVSEKAGRVADIAQDGPHKGTLILWDGYAGENQSFTIIQQGGIYLIKCRNGKGYLTVESAADGARFFLSPNPTEQSKFRLDEVSPGSHTYIIYTFCNKVVDLYQGLKDNGTQIIQWTYNGNTNQQWYLNDPKNITSSSSDRG